LDTYVGFGGGQLSGGQKQRIAIARTIIKNPKVLLLDEATSALDRRNERLILKTLDRISEGRTTITVAHRVKTIMHSNIIYVLERGVVKEKGAFNDISRFRGQKIEPDYDDDFGPSKQGELEEKA
jgi:ATP-binding cassette, subfamily B (MDR/TAP), member 1